MLRIWRKLGFRLSLSVFIGVHPWFIHLLSPKKEAGPKSGFRDWLSRLEAVGDV
jgi:hypothetical protein